MANVVVIKDGLFVAQHPSAPTVGIVTAEEARLSQAAGWARSSIGIGARTGVVYAGVSTLLTGTATSAPSMTIAVVPLTAVCQKAPAEGVYTPSSIGVVLLDVAAAPGSNSRVDVIYILQRDAASPTAPDGITQGELGVVTGVAGAIPGKPAIPAGAVEVGTVTVPAGATATTGCTIATTCLWTAPLGSPIPVRNQAERDALTAYDGLLAYRLDTGTLERSDGTTWSAIGSPVWQAYTPTWGSTGVQPFIGPGGTITGRYAQIGKVVHCYGEMVLGGTGLSGGTGAWILNLPVAANLAVPVIIGLLCTAKTGAAPVVGVGTLANSNQFTLAYPNSATTSLLTGNATGLNSPGGVPWSGGGYIRWSCTYEAA